MARPRLAAQVLGLVGIASLTFIFLLLNAFPLLAQTSVITYHNDTYRTGWNNTETTLTPSNVNASQFGLLYTVTVDDQVDAQPLVVPNVNITAGAIRGNTTSSMSSPAMTRSMPSTPMPAPCC